MAPEAPHVAPLEIRLFGPMEVLVHGSPLPRLRSRKGQWLLAHLVLRGGASVDRSWMAGVLWPDSPEAQSLASLRQSLADLRKALGPEAGRLLSPSGRSIQLDLTGVDPDVLRFDALVQRGDPGSLESAVALYRGPLVEGCEEESLWQERAAREEVWLWCLDTLARQTRVSGDPSRAVGYYCRLVAADPLRESAVRGLMRALADAGDYAAATIAYRELRQRLLDEVHGEPSRETAELFQQIRADGRSRAAGARPVATAQPERPPARYGAANDLAGRLPSPLTELIGRDLELREVTALVMRARLVTLAGAGGVGKTRLAIEAARRMEDQFEDGSRFVDLSPLSDPNLVEQATAAAVGAREVPGQSLLATLKEALLSRSVLLVLDNCEHLLDACAGLAEELLLACPELKVLATSRQPLGITGEWVWRVPSLPVPEDARSAQPDALMQYESVRLFVERARAARSDFRLEGPTAGAVAQICRRLDGIPLALELAAGRLRGLTAPQISERLDDRFRLLTEGSRTALPRQKTLSALIDWSYDLLAEPSQRLLRLLAVFAGGCTVEAVAAVCCEKTEDGRQGTDEDGRSKTEDGGRGTEAAMRTDAPRLESGDFSTTHELLAALVDRSLVQMEVLPDGSLRYSLLDTIRQYGRERMNEQGELEELHRRHAEYFAEFAQAAQEGLNGPDQLQWVWRIEREHENIRTALGAAVDGMVSHVTAWRIVWAMARFWGVRGYLSEARRWLEQVLALSEEEEPAEVRAGVLNAAGIIANNQGDYQAARTFHEEALALRRRSGDERGMAGSFHNLGLHAVNTGDYARARELYERALAINRKNGNYAWAAINLNSLGYLANRVGDYGVARPLLEEALALSEEHGLLRNRAAVLDNLGDIAYHEGDLELAQERYSAALGINREMGNVGWVSVALLGLGNVAVRRNDPEEACRCLRESLEIARDRGDKRIIAEALSGYARVAASLNRKDLAVHLYAASERLRQEMGLAAAPVEARALEQEIAGLRIGLGEESFRRAWSDGASAPVEAVVERALAECR